MAAQEKVKVEANQAKIDELLALANGPLELDPIKQEVYQKAETLAKEAFGGLSPGIKDAITNFALYKDSECVGASDPHTSWYNPNVDWVKVQQVVEALWDIQEKTTGVKLFDRSILRKAD